MQATANNLRQVLPRGAMAEIAKKLGISRQAVSTAITKGKPGNRAVIEALHIAESSGALAAAQQLAILNS